MPLLGRDAILGREGPYMSRFLLNKCFCFLKLEISQRLFGAGTTNSPPISSFYLLKSE